MCCDDVKEWIRVQTENIARYLKRMKPMDILEFVLKNDWVCVGYYYSTFDDFEYLSNRLANEISKAMLEDEEFERKFGFGLMRDEIGECAEKVTLPTFENIFEYLKRKLYKVVRPVAESIIRVLTVEFDFSFLHDPSNPTRRPLTEFPKELKLAIREKSTLSSSFGMEYTMIDTVNLSNNQIKNMCYLAKLQADKIYVEGNPIEKIMFRDKRQFLNVVYLNDFGTTHLPEGIREGLKKCAEEIRSLVNLSSKGVIEHIEPPERAYSLRNEEVKAYFTYTESCERVYNEIKEGGGCKEEGCIDTLDLFM